MDVRTYPPPTLSNLRLVDIDSLIIISPMLYININNEGWRIATSTHLHIVITSLLSISHSNITDKNRRYYHRKDQGV